VETLLQLRAAWRIVRICNHDIGHVGPPTLADIGLSDRNPLFLTLDFRIAKEIVGFGIQVDRVVRDAVLAQGGLEFWPNRIVAADVPVPPGAAVDSVNMLPLLFDPDKAPGLDGMFYKGKASALRVGDWAYHPQQGPGGLFGGGPIIKLSQTHSDYDETGKIKPDAPQEQLYNLGTDPHQTQNLVNSEPEVVAAMKDIMKKYSEAKHAAENGNDVVMAPTTHTYFDSGQGEHPDGPQYEVIGRTLTAQKVHEFEPIPDNFTPEETKRVLGCQAQLWSEYFFNWSKVEYMAFPRTCALAEVAWSPKEGKDWGDFEGRLNNHLKRFDALKVNYRRADGTPAVTELMGRGE